MAITLATGTVVSIGSTFGSGFTISAISNANPAIATLSGSHGVVIGDYIEITSGWDRLNGRVVRVSNVSTNDVTLENINTSSTTFYPAGTGAGSGREITAWTTISQITANISVSGGDQQFADITTLSDSIQKQIPTQRNAVAVTLPVFDDPSLAWYAVVNTAAESATATPVRMAFPNGSKLVAGAYWSLQTVPTIEDSTLRARIDLAFTSTPTRYAT